MWSDFVYFCGWLPAIIFPTGSILQLIKLLKVKTADGVSKSTWALFSLGNAGTYIYIEKYFEWQSLGFLLAAGTQLAIVVVALKKRKALAA